MSNPLADYEQRQRALDPKCSFCVSAPAGSGKTGLLIQRYLTLLPRMEQPEEVLAITFTRKAAAEMRARIIEALERAASQSCPADPHSAQTWNLARAVLAVDAERDWQLNCNPTRLNIKVIDGFCAGLTRQMPVLSGFGGSISPVDDCMPVYREATRALLNRLGSDHPIAADLSRVLLQFDGNWDRLENLLVGMLNCRDQWLVHMGTGLSRDTAQEVLQRSVTMIVEDTLAGFLTDLGSFREELLSLYSYSCEQLDLGTPQFSSSASADDLPAWQAAVDMLLTGKHAWRKTVNKNQGFPSGSDAAKARKQQHSELLASLQAIPEMLVQLQEVRHLPSQQPDDEHWQLVLAVSRLLPMLAAELSVAFQQRGEVDHTQVAMAALDALGDDDNVTDLALKLDYRLGHILVDEFQDTAVSQYELIRRLTRRWGEENAENPDNPRTIFIVGDGMQSIYGFRDADVGLFMRARESGFNGVQLEGLDLLSNFRSDAALVAWVNASFNGAFPASDNIRKGAIRFSSATAQLAARQAEPVNIAAFAQDDADPGAQEAAWIVDRIDAGLADAGCESIAVLVRTRAQLSPIVAELKARGIQWQAQDIDLLASSSLVRDLQTLTRALHNHADRVAWLALLRAPWCGLAQADLLTVARSVGGHSLWPGLREETLFRALSKDGATRLRGLVAVLELAVGRRERLGLRDWIESTWLALRGPAATEHADQLAEAEEFLDLLEQRDNLGEPYDETLLADQVASLYASDAVGNSKLQLMTLHKAKGLEFDWVFLPGLARAPRSEQRDLLLWDDYHHDANSELGFLLAVDDQEAATEPTLYNYLHRHKRAKREREATRLLYVGVTRAARRLFLTATCEREEGSGEWKAPRERSLLHSIWATFSAQMEEPTPRAGSAPAADPVPAGALLRLASPLPCEGDVAEEPVADGANIPDPPGEPLARHIGTVIHLSLQRLSALDESELESFDCEQLHAWWRSRLRGLQLVGRDMKVALDRVEHSVRNVLADERGRRILSSQRQEAHSEYALSCLRADGRLAEYIIDRTYVEDKVRWVVDYKSSVPDSGQSLDDFLERETENHRPQLDIYRELMSGTDSCEVRTALYFTAIPHWLELT